MVIILKSERYIDYIPVLTEVHSYVVLVDSYVILVCSLVFIDIPNQLIEPNFS